MVHKYKTRSFLFSLTIDFLKMLIDLAFLISTFKFITFAYTIWKNVLLKNLVLVETGLVIEADYDFNK